MPEVLSEDSKISAPLRLIGKSGEVLIWLAFFLGMWLAVIAPLGPGFSRVPGDLGDSRLNNYILEHFFRWLAGLDQSYWNASFLYPYMQVIAFGDNLLGSAFVYAFLRALGLDTLSAFQGWYVAGFACNFLASVFVLKRLRFGSLAIAIAAFFFTFGLPMLAQEYHVQLLYRFGVPLAAYFLWSFYEEPRLGKLAWCAFWLVWQFYLVIYIGILLVFLLAAMMILLPFCFPAGTLRERLAAWPQRLGRAWGESGPVRRAGALSALVLLGLGLAALLRPYYLVTRMYGFSRSVKEIMSMLPQPQSYLIESRDGLWNWLAGPLLKPLLARLPALQNPQEHQLFPGIAILLLLGAGLFLLRSRRDVRLAWLNLGVLAILALFTLRIGGFSLYIPISRLPGIDSLRAIGRVSLVMMWPLSIFVAWSVDGLLAKFAGRPALVVAVGLLAGLLVLETGAYHHASFAKADAQARLVALRQQIPFAVPAQPILLVAEDPGERSAYSELDAMLLAQQLGWPTMNGYTGNYPPAANPTRDCDRFNREIDGYLAFADVPDANTFYLGMLRRLVPVGFSRCYAAQYQGHP